MVELEDINLYRFYKLIPSFRQRCVCNGLLWLHMTHGSVNMKCKHVGCFKEYEIPRFCSHCGKEHVFEDLTCDNCEKIVINIATWKTSVEECNKAIRKVNRLFKNNLISESEWKAALKINEEEIERCQKSLQETGIIEQVEDSNTE